MAAIGQRAVFSIGGTYWFAPVSMATAVNVLRYLMASRPAILQCKFPAAAVAEHIPETIKQFPIRAQASQTTQWQPSTEVCQPCFRAIG